jgi:hypothetical protein
VASSAELGLACGDCARFATALVTAALATIANFLSVSGLSSSLDRSVTDSCKDKIDLAGRPLPPQRRGVFPRPNTHATPLITPLTANRTCFSRRDGRESLDRMLLGVEGARSPSIEGEGVEPPSPTIA